VRSLEHIKHVMKLEKPETVEDLLINCGLSLKFIGEGAFRFVFKVVGTGLVMKVPMLIDEQTEMGAQYDHTPFDHAMIEWAYRKKVMRYKKYEFFRPYMPAYHYIVPSTGVMLTDYYKPVSYARTKYNAEIERIIDKLAEMGIDDGDVGPDKKDNYGLTRDGKLKILDLGCFGGELE